MILASNKRRSRLNKLLVSAVAFIALSVGGLATFGAIQVLNMMKGDAVAEAAPAPTEVAVTRISPNTLQQVAEPIRAQPVAAGIASPVVRQAPSGSFPQSLTSGQEIQVLSLAAIAGSYELVAQDHGDFVRVGLHYRDLDPVADLLRQKLDLAAQNGEVDATFARLAGSQRVDTQILLFEMVTSQLESGGAESHQAARTLRQRAFAASDARTVGRDGVRYYTVRPGDSLAYIALQFYGSTRSARQIYGANQGLLGADIALQPGMELIIPNA